MQRGLGVLGLCVAVAIGVNACGSPRPSKSAGTTTSPDKGIELNDLQLAGQHIVYSFAGTTPPPGLLQQIRHGEVAGVILFALQRDPQHSGNIVDRQQAARLIAQLQAARRAGPPGLRELPLLIMVDQEGGGVRRIARGAGALSRAAREAR